MKQNPLTILFLLLRTVCFSQYDSANLNNWKVYDIPSDSIAVEQYNGSNNHWIVYDSNNSVYAKQQGRAYYLRNLPFELHPEDMNEGILMRCPKAIIKVDDGYLISFYRGEFGGYLYWFSHDGSQKKRVSRALIVQFIERDNRIFAIAGLDHMGLNIGSVLELKNIDCNWTIAKYLELPSTPYAVQKDSKNSFIIVTSNNLISVDRGGNVSAIFNNGFWSCLYPTSLVLKGEVCFVGMREGVFKYNLETSDAKWLLRR